MDVAAIRLGFDSDSFGKHPDSIRIRLEGFVSDSNSIRIRLNHFLRFGFDSDSFGWHSDSDSFAWHLLFVCIRIRYHSDSFGPGIYDICIVGPTVRRPR